MPKKVNVREIRKQLTSYGKAEALLARSHGRADNPGKRAKAVTNMTKKLAKLSEHGINIDENGHAFMEGSGRSAQKVLGRLERARSGRMRKARAAKPDKNAWRKATGALAKGGLKNSEITGHVIAGMARQRADEAAVLKAQRSGKRLPKEKPLTKKEAGGDDKNAWRRATQKLARGGLKNSEITGNVISGMVAQRADVAKELRQRRASAKRGGGGGGGGGGGKQKRVPKGKSGGGRWTK